MQRRKILLLLILLISLILIVKNFYKEEKEEVEIKKKHKDEVIYNSNIIENVNYTSKDIDGNEYTINATKGEIDYTNSHIIYLTNVNATINLKNSNIIKIKSNFGKYNSNNFDTIFSKNVIINYLENKMTGEYLDFSLQRNSIIISRDVVYTNLNNVLKADVVEINLKTKDTKIFMYDQSKKVNIQRKF